MTWPLVVLVGLLLFRKPIAERLKAIQKIKHKDTEVLFDHEAREVQAAIAAATGAVVPDPPGNASCS